MDKKSFKVNDKISVNAWSERTRSGFRHIADLFVDGEFKESAKVCYQNRTWESYKFQTVLKKVLAKSKNLSTEEKELGFEYANQNHSDFSNFKTVSTIAKMSEVFCQTPKEKNDWKLRMLKAGLESKGLDIPKDWDTLDEETKQERLNGLIKILDE